MEKDQQANGDFPRLTPIKQSMGFYFNCADEKIKFTQSLPIDSDQTYL